MALVQQEPKAIKIWTTAVKKVYLWNTIVRPTWWDMDNWTLSQTSNSLSSNWWWWVFFNTDWTKIFLSQYGNGGRVYESSLQNPYDISSMTFNKYISIQHPEDIHFSTDGTKLFVLKSDVSPYSVLRYSLSTAWDISTATQDQTLSRTSPRDRWLYITPDGKSLYIGRVTHNSETPDVELYSLSTAWDLSTAWTSTVISTTLWWMWIWFWKWWKMYFKQDEWEGVLSYYNLSTPYDLSTATLGWTKSVWANRAWWIWFNDIWTICAMVWWWTSTNYVTKYTL